MKECGFCFQHAAKLSGEHIFSDWMNKLFTESWERTFKHPDGRAFTFQASELDWKEKVVCEDCNNGWMSEIESEHASPALTPLIVGGMGFPVTPSMAKSIAIFAFKTAAVLDLMPVKQKHQPPFFSRRIRAGFRQNLTIPPMVWMWMCPYLPANLRADTFVSNYHGELPSIGPIQLYVCTYAIGHFVFQVLSLKSIEVSSKIVAGDSTFNNVAVRFWPDLIPGLVWPRPFALRSLEEFEKFHRRWEGVFSVVG